MASSHLPNTLSKSPPQPPQAHPKSPPQPPQAPPQPPEAHPKSRPQELPLQQHISLPPNRLIQAEQQAIPMSIHSQEQPMQGDDDLQQTGEFLEQVSLYEGEEAEHQQNKQSKNQIVQELDNQNQLIQERSDLRHVVPVQKSCELVAVCKETLAAPEATTNKHLEEVNLAAIMQSLQIAIPGEIEVGYQGEEIQQSEESSPFQLLMKVASSSGTPRNIPLQPLNEAMSKAWGNNYWIIDQVKHATYKAYFRDDVAMDFVLQRQPWSLEGDNLLLEWINPRNANKNPDEYNFSYIYVPIRVYGVPQRFRTPHLMQYVIDKVAQPSDIHPPPEIKMVIRDDYMSAYAKMDVRVPVKDKVKYYVSPNEYIMFYLHYDRVKRICTFCGLMFHTVQFCPNRRKLIHHLQSIGASTNSVPFSYVGIWTSQATKIPQEAFEQAKVFGGLTPQFRLAMKVDKSAETTSQPLSRFTLSDMDSGQKNLQGKENCEFHSVIEQIGTKPVSLPAPTQVQLHQKSILGPLPQLHSTNDTITIAKPDVVRTSNQHNISGPPYARDKHSEQLNLSTCATYKRQQPSESALAQRSLKRQATADPIREKEQEKQKKEGFVFSDVASSQAHSSGKQKVYHPPQECFGQDSGSYLENSSRLQITQAAHQVEDNAIKFAPGRDTLYAGERRIIRPKRRSRQDRRVGNQTHNASVSKFSAEVIDNHSAGVIQEANKIAPNYCISNNASPHMVNHMKPMDQATSLPWMSKVADVTRGAVSQRDLHWGMQPPYLHTEPQLIMDARDNIAETNYDDNISMSSEDRDMDNNGAYFVKEMGDKLQQDTDQALALASKAPQTHFQAAAPAFKAPQAQ